MSDDSNRTLEVYVLYASQTGNSEQAAIEFCDELHSTCTAEYLQKKTGTSDTITIKANHMQMDDFLELKQCKFVSHVVILICSSYGVGQAPLGGYRFRDLCDEWLENNDSDNETILDGLYFGMCGLGDSSYTTFFNNPTTVYNGMQKVGAKPVGPLGKADASGSGDEDQRQVIQKWMKEMITEHLPKVLVKPPLAKNRLSKMQLECIQFCQRINPDFEAMKNKFGIQVKQSNISTAQTTDFGTLVIMLAPFMMVALAMLLGYIMQSNLSTA